MAKRYQNKEKVARNEAYALKYQKKQSLEDLAAKKELRWKGGLWGNWCRYEGHPASCSCAYE